MMKKIILAALLISLNLIAFGQQKSEKSKQSQSLEDKIQNPIANLVSVPVQNNYSFSDRNSFSTNIQPVIPIVLSKKWLMVTRTIIPFMTVPLGPTERKTGLGNVILTTAITPLDANSFTYGFGPAFIFPTVTEFLGFRDFSIGPSLGALNQANGWTYGGFFQQFFGVAGAKNLNGDHTNYSYLQVAASKKLKKGWYINSNPVITADWTAEKGKQWTIPMGMGVGKLIKGKTPINAQVGLFKYIEHPQNVDWFVRFQLTFIFINK